MLYFAFSGLRSERRRRRRRDVPNVLRRDREVYPDVVVQQQQPLLELVALRQPLRVLHDGAASAAASTATAASLQLQPLLCLPQQEADVQVLCPVQDTPREARIGMPT